MPYAQKVVDKFHVMQYVYDAVLDVRSRLKKELAEKLSKGKEKSEEDTGKKELAGKSVNSDKITQTNPCCRIIPGIPIFTIILNRA
jgi:transposase